MREFTDDDVHLAFELGDDPYIPLTGSLPALPTEQQSLEWIHRQRGRFTEGQGLSFAIADAESDSAVGAIGLWLQNMSAGRATVGYSVADAHRGRGMASSALKALTAFAWTIPALHRSLYEHVVAVQATLHISCRRLGKWPRPVPGTGAPASDRAPEEGCRPPPEKGQPAAVSPVVLDHGEGHARIGQDGAEVLQEA